MLEVEQKFQVAELAPWRERIMGRFADVRATVLQQTDLYLAHPCRDFNETDEAFRIRYLDERMFLTYKGPRQFDSVAGKTTKTRREIELELPLAAEDREQFPLLLQALGFQPVARVEKRRENLATTCNGKPLTFALDQVSQLGCFVEVEVISDAQQLVEAQQLVRHVADQLGLKDSIESSYLELLLAAAGPNPDRSNASAAMTWEKHPGH